MVARDFSGARWRRKPGPAQQFDSILEVAFKKRQDLRATQLLTKALGGIPSDWSDVCDFIKPPKSQTEWLIRKHGAFKTDREESGLSLQKTRPATMRRGSTSASEHAKCRTRTRPT